MKQPISVSFLLVKLFPLYCLILGTEVLRLANRYAGKRLFEWHYTSQSGLPVEASNSSEVVVEYALKDLETSNYLLTIAGDDPLADFSPEMKQVLQRLSRQKVIMGAIDSGAFVLAEAQLLRDQTITLHPTGATYSCELM